jgi:hypothetical protein
MADVRSLSGLCEQVCSTMWAQSRLFRQRLSHRLRRSTPSASLLVLVDVKWTRWRGTIYKPGTADPWRRHIEFLRSLLCDDPGPEQRAHLDAWILHDPNVGDVKKLITAARGHEANAARQILIETENGLGLFDLSSAETRPGPSSLPWGTGSVAEVILSRLETGLHLCDDLLDRLVIENPTLMTALLNLFTCRIYLRSNQLHRLAGRPAAPFSAVADDTTRACIDFRFHYHVGSYWLYAYLSVWSSEPASAAHTPFPIMKFQTESRPLDIETIREKFVEDLSKSFSAQLYRSFPPVDIEAFRKLF